MQALSNERPFPGLRPFDYGDQDFFFGRHSQVASLYGLLDRSRFVAVIGSSGCGKSSLTRAGLLPVLEEENTQSRSGKWMWCSMRPGDAPLAALADAIANLADANDGSDDSDTMRDIRRQHIRHQLNKSSFGLADAVAEAGVSADDKFVLVVDQFEELFRYSDQRIDFAQDRLREATSRNEAKQFVELLMEGRRSTERDIRVLMTMRSDFIGDCADFPGLPEAVSATQFLVPGLERDQIELIIEAPIKKAGAGIEPALVQQLLTDVEGEPDQLPVLQHCLLQLWQQAGSAAAASAGRTIDFDCYDKAGKISNALSVHAEKILRDFREEAVEAVFRALSEIKDGRAIRRALPYAQLREECGIPDVELREVVDRFRADDCSFLVTSPSGVDVLKDDTVIDVGHEALLRRWERIRGAPGATGDSEDKRPIGWLRQERKDGRKYQILLSMLEGHRTSDEVEDIDHYWKWWNERRRTPQWAERYGGNYDGVDKLLRKGLAQQRKARLRIASLAAVAGLLFVFVLVQTYQHYRDANRYLVQQARAEQNKRLADDNFAQSIDITKKFLDETLFALNHGDMKVSAAVVMESVAQHTVERLQDAESSPGKATFDPSPRTLALEVALDNTATDILIKKKGSEGDAFPIATNAKNIAEKLVRLNAANDEWQKLLYESTFRYADLLAEKDPKAALPEYRHARDITQKLAEKNPGDGEQQYHLAFVNVKIGEMFRDAGNNEDALKQLRLALEIAERLAAGHPDNPEWQAYAPSTMTKIGITLTRLPQPDYQGALAQYDAALARQNTLVEKFGRDGVIFSNMASSRIGKAEVLAKTRQWAQAKAEFSTAIADREKLAAGDNANVTALEYLASDYKKFIVALNDQAAPDMASASEPATDYQALFKTAVDAAEKEVHVRQTLVEIDPTNQLRIKSLAQAQKTLEDLKGRISPPNQ